MYQYYYNSSLYVHPADFLPNIYVIILLTSSSAYAGEQRWFDHRLYSTIRMGTKHFANVQLVHFIYVHVLYILIHPTLSLNFQTIRDNEPEEVSKTCYLSGQPPLHHLAKYQD